MICSKCCRGTTLHKKGYLDEKHADIKEKAAVEVLLFEYQKERQLWRHKNSAGKETKYQGKVTESGKGSCLCMSRSQTEGNYFHGDRTIMLNRKSPHSPLLHPCHLYNYQQLVQGI